MTQNAVDFRPCLQCAPAESSQDGSAQCRPEICPRYRAIAPGRPAQTRRPTAKRNRTPPSSPPPALSQPTLDIPEPDDADPVTQELRQQQEALTNGRLRPVRNRAGRVVMARVSKRRCTGSCQHAKGSTCACGGINHGVGGSI